MCSYQDLDDMVDGEHAALRHGKVLVDRQPRGGNACSGRLRMREPFVPVVVDEPADNVRLVGLQRVQERVGFGAQVDELFAWEQVAVTTLFACNAHPILVAVRRQSAPEASCTPFAHAHAKGARRGEPSRSAHPMVIFGTSCPPSDANVSRIGKPARRLAQYE